MLPNWLWGNRLRDRLTTRSVMAFHSFKVLRTSTIVIHRQEFSAQPLLELHNREIFYSAYVRLSVV